MSFQAQPEHQLGVSSSFLKFAQHTRIKTTQILQDINTYACLVCTPFDRTGFQPNRQAVNRNDGGGAHGHSISKYKQPIEEGATEPLNSPIRHPRKGRGFFNLLRRGTVVASTVLDWALFSTEQRLPGRRCRFRWLLERLA